MPGAYPVSGMTCYKRGLMLQPMKIFSFITAITMRISKMLRRITLLIPLLALLTLSGCIIYPHGGRHHDHYYGHGGPGYYQHR